MAKAKQHPPGVIGFSIGDIVRYVEFVVSLQRGWRPDGTTSSYGQSVSIPENMNTIIRGMPDDAQWLWIQADDHVWEADALRKLLDLELDVVVPLIIRRGPPFVPVINSKYRGRSYKPFPYQDIPTSGVFEVPIAGTGGMLIRRHVLQAIIDMQGHDRVFEVEKGDKLAEDYFFCKKIAKAGFKIHCCPEVTMGHRGNFTVWPMVGEDGKWVLRFDMGRTQDGHVSSFYYATDQQEVM